MIVTVIGVHIQNSKLSIERLTSEPVHTIQDGVVNSDGYYFGESDRGGVHLNANIFSGILWDIREGFI